jgi:hypothetical protein
MAVAALGLWTHATFALQGPEAPSALAPHARELTVAEPLAPKISARPASDPIGLPAPTTTHGEVRDPVVTGPLLAEAPLPPPRPLAAPTPLRN